MNIVNLKGYYLSHEQEKKPNTIQLSNTFEHTHTHTHKKNTQNRVQPALSLLPVVIASQ